MTKYVIMVKVNNQHFYWNMKTKTLVNSRYKASTWKKLETVQNHLMNFQRIGEDSAYISEL